MATSIFLKTVHMWRFKPNRPNHKIVSDFAAGIDPLQVAADFDELLIK